MQKLPGQTEKNSVHKGAILDGSGKSHRCCWVCDSGNQYINQPNQSFLRNSHGHWWLRHSFNMKLAGCCSYKVIVHVGFKLSGGRLRQIFAYVSKCWVSDLGASSSKSFQWSSCEWFWGKHSTPCGIHHIITWWKIVSINTIPSTWWPPYN